MRPNDAALTEILSGRDSMGLRIRGALAAWVDKSHGTMERLADNHGCSARDEGQHCCLDAEHDNYDALIEFLANRVSDVDLGGEDLLQAMARELLELRVSARCTTMRCAVCGGEPDTRDHVRILDDLNRHPSPQMPVAWYCPSCAPELEMTASGLAWHVVDVGGASPPEDE